jgi:hypothetical protein
VEVLVMRIFARSQRLMAVVLLAWHLPSCTSAAGWRTQTVVPQETKRTMYAGDVRVTTTDGSTHAFRGVWVSADSLGGWLAEPAGTEKGFPLTDVSAVRTRRMHRPSRESEVSRIWKGAAVLVGLVAVFGGVGLATCFR